MPGGLLIRRRQVRAAVSLIGHTLKIKFIPDITLGDVKDDN
jgi:hypothetical protein